jgi:hypothetical protein
MQDTTHNKHVFDHSGDMQITSAFMGAMSAIWKLEKANFLKYNAMICDIKDCYGDATGEQKKRCIEEMKALKAEALKLPKKHEFFRDVTVHADTSDTQKIAVEIADADLPF